MSPQEPGGRTGGETGVSVMVGNCVISIEGEVFSNQRDGRSNVRVGLRISSVTTQSTIEFFLF